MNAHRWESESDIYDSLCPPSDKAFTRLDDCLVWKCTRPAILLTAFGVLFCCFAIYIYTQMRYIPGSAWFFGFGLIFATQPFRTAQIVASRNRLVVHRKYYGVTLKRIYDMQHARLVVRYRGSTGDDNRYEVYSIRVCNGSERWLPCRGTRGEMEHGLQRLSEVMWGEEPTKRSNG